MSDLPRDNNAGADTEQTATTVQTAETLNQDPWAHGAWPALGAMWVLVLAILVELILLFQSYSSESYIFGLASLLVFAAVLHLGGWVHAVHAVIKRPWRTATVLALYVALGAAWICGYWAVESRKAARVAMEDKIAWMRTNGLEGTTVPDSHLEAWRDHVSANPRIYSIPRWYEHKSELAWRGLFWPVSVVHTFLADIVYEVYLRIVEAFGDALDGISRWMFEDVLQELETPAAQR